MDNSDVYLMDYGIIPNLIGVLQRGIDNNIIVYDSEASPGIFTKRLLAIMKTIYRQNGPPKSRLLHLYVSEDSRADYELWHYPFMESITYTQYGSYPNINALGVNLHFINMKTLVDRFISGNNVFAPRKTDLIIGLGSDFNLTDDRTILLGCY